MAGLISWLGSNLQKAEKQINPFDNGATFKNPNPPQPATPQPSVLQQATHDVASIAPKVFNVATFGLGHAIAPVEQKIFQATPFKVQQAVQHLPTPLSTAGNFVNNSFVKPLATLGVHSAQLAQGQNPYHGTNEQIAGQLGNDALAAGSLLPIGKVSEAVTASRGLPLATRALQSARTGAKFGAGFGAAQGLTNSLAQNQSLPQIALHTGIGGATGGAFGGLTGGAVPVVGHGIGLAGRGTVTAGKAAIKTAKTIDEKALTPRASLHDQQILRDFSDHLAGANPATGTELNTLISDARQVGAKHGVDLTNGSIADRMDRANSILDQIGKTNRSINEGGYLGAPEAPEPFPQKGLQGRQPKVSGSTEDNGTSLTANPTRLGPSRTLSPSLTRPELPNTMSAEELASLDNSRGIAPSQSTTQIGGQTLPQLSERTSSLKPNIELDRGVQNTLRTGTVDDAIQTVMDVTGADLQTASKYVSRVAKHSKIDLGFEDAAHNPKLGTVSVPRVKAGDVSQANLNARYVHESEQAVGKKALDSFNKLSAHDQVLLKDIETGTVSKVAQRADNPQAFKQAEQAIRDYYDTRHAYDRYLGIDVGYRTNYLRQLFNKAEQVAPDMQISMKASGKRPGYTKERSQETLGTDVAQALQKDIQGASFNHAKLVYEKGLTEALDGKVANGELVRTPADGTYVQVQNKYGQDLSVPKSAAHTINTRTWGDNASKALNRYDALNHGLKYMKLSGGFFHAFTEAGNFTGQQLASGKLITNPTATGKLFKVFFSPKTMDREMARLAQNGTLDKAHLSGLTLQAKQILADVSVNALEKGTNKIARLTGIQKIHDATFQREIPYAKAKLFEQKTQGLDVNSPADLAKMREVARSINNVFGGINREINGIKPSTFKWLQRGLLATDFTEGKWHTLFDAATHGGAAGTIARQAVVGKAILFGILASAGAAAGGEFNGKSPAQVAKNAAGNLLDPQFEIGGYTAKLPKTYISEAIDALKPTKQATGAPWNASGLLSYAQARGAALPVEAAQLLGNKDYYGQPLYGKNTKKNGGGPISPLQAGFNITNTVAPIPFGQGVKTAGGKQNIAAGIANVAGLNVRPNPNNTVSFQGVQTNLTDPQRRVYDSQLTSTQKALLPQLTNSNVYKNMSPNDQANAVAQLKSNITSAVQRDYAAKNNLGQYAPNFTGKDTQATVKQQNVLAGKIDPASYIKGASTGTTIAKGLDPVSKNTLTKYNAMSPADRAKTFNAQTSAEYQYDLAKYNNDKAKGTLTTAQDIKTQGTLRKEQVGSIYPKNVRDLYALNKTELYTYLTTNDGKTDKAKIAKQLIAYDQALYNAGISSTLKFKNGIAPSSGSGSSSKFSPFAAQLKFNAAASTPKIATFSGLPQTPSKYAPPVLRKYTPKTVAGKGKFTYSVHKGLV